MKTLDYAVIGSGIGGASFAALNSDKNLMLFEKDHNLGGCASTFSHKGYCFNAGATTFAGYEEGHIVKNIFDRAKVVPKIKKTKVAYQVIQDDTIINRYQNFEAFISEIERSYPNKNNRIFWSKIKEIDEKFWELKNIYFARYSLFDFLKTLIFATKLVRHFRLDIFQSSERFIQKILGDISKEYYDFINASLQITVQQTTKDLPLIFCALGLAYPFHDLYYPYGGMGELVKDLLQNIDYKTNCGVKYIEKYKDEFILYTKNEAYQAKNIILGTSIFDSGKLFDDEKIRNFYEDREFSDQSAFVIYLKLDVKQEFLHHYQVILDDKIINCTSNSYFVSFSDKDDSLLSKDGYSITISTHTKANLWKNLDKEKYEKKKQETIAFIKKDFLQRFGLDDSSVNICFGATSKTFHKFIGRYNCGGISANFKNILALNGIATPFKGIYHLGDTILGAQGWPGVALGVDMLDRKLHG